jgi:hypothetical protein
MARLVVRRAPSAEEGAIFGRVGDLAMAIANELSDNQAQALSEAAARLQVPEAELGAAAVRNMGLINPLISMLPRNGCLRRIRSSTNA